MTPNITEPMGGVIFQKKVLFVAMGEIINEAAPPKAFATTSHKTTFIHTDIGL